MDKCKKTYSYILSGLLAGIVPGACLFLGDEVLKARVEKGRIKLPVANTTNLREKTVLNGKISLRYLRNAGIMRGAFEYCPQMVKYASLAFTSVSGLGLLKALISWWEHSREKGVIDIVWLLGLSLVTAGGVSNTKDRMKRGYVTDYFSFVKAPKYIQKLVFNISDMGIIAGVLMAFLVYCLADDN